MSPAPNDAATDRMYSQPGPSATDRIGDIVGRVTDAARDPTEADGWVGILLPAIVTGVAIETVRRWL